jgi:hypothetical protein
LAVAGVLVWRLGDRLEVAGLVLWLWMASSALRAAPLLAKVALASPDEQHPALRLVTAPTERLAAQSAWWIAAWLAASKVSTFTMVSLLDADRMRDVVGALSSVLLWALMAALVLAWGPVAAATLARQAEHTPLTAWASRATGTGWPLRLLRLPQHAAAIAIVLLQTTVHVTGRLVEGRAGLGWLQSAMARRQLKADDTEASDRVVPVEVVQAVEEGARRGMPRPDMVERVRTAVEAWEQTGQRGLVSVIGDAATGKSQLLDSLSAALDRPVDVLVVEHRIEAASGVAAFLGEGLGLASRDEAGVIAELAAMPPRVIAIDRAHLLFLRRVRGYDPLAALVQWMIDTSDRHFWVLSVHEPAWDYLMGVAARLKVDAFRDHLRLGRVPAPELAGWLEELTNATGHSVSYRGLATTGLLGGDEGLAERRARTAFWRLLGDAAGGAPGNAARLWLASMSQGAAGELDVRMFDAPDSETIEGLSDELLFALKALVVHERLSVTELAAVLNRRSGSVRTSAHFLVGLGVAEVTSDGLSYALIQRWGPAVQRLLRQKHFLYGE